LLGGTLWQSAMGNPMQKNVVFMGKLSQWPILPEKMVKLPGEKKTK
jgi:hypothetical protein